MPVSQCSYILYIYIPVYECNAIKESTKNSISRATEKQLSLPFSFLPSLEMQSSFFLPAMAFEVEVEDAALVYYPDPLLVAPYMSLFA